MTIKTVAIRGGHNSQALGASGIIDETTEDRKVKDAAIKYLKLAGITVLDVTPSNMDVNSDLFYGVNKANSANVDLFVSIHFNKAFNTYNGALGSEVWLNPSNSNATAIGTKIVSNLASLGFENRGLKDGINGEHLYEVKNTNMVGMIVEVCFVEATEDVKIYKNVGYDVIGKKIAEGIIGHNIDIPQPKPQPTPNQDYDHTIPTGNNIHMLGNFAYIEETADKRLIMHKDKANYIAIGQGFIDIFWNDGKGNKGNKRLNN